MSANQSILIQAKFRFLYSFLIFGLLAVLAGFVSFQAVNVKALDVHRNNAISHYVKVIADLERRWGRAAFNFKIRLESVNLLSNIIKNNDKLLTYLTAQGGSTEFPSLRIDNLNGKTLFSFEYVADSIVEVSFMPDQETTWALNPKNNKLFLVIRQLIWLGNENGYLLLFHPMDHALLNQISYPETRLSLWWDDKPVASSEGEHGLSLAKLNVDHDENDRSVFFVPWAGIETVKTPKILVESSLHPLVDQSQFLLALAAILVVYLFSFWSVLGAWGVNNISRIQALDRAQRIFKTGCAVDEKLVKELEVAHAYKNDEISSIVVESEKLMRLSVTDMS